MATINSTLISGAGAFTALLPLLAGKRRILLVTDGNVGKLHAAQQIRALLQDEGRQVQIVDTVPAEPSQHDMAQIQRLVSASEPQLIVGIGGGSVLDVTKLLSVLLHPCSPGLDALLAGEKPQQKVTSLLIPATAGTGSEATPNAILAIPEQSTKVGIISPVLLPDYVALLPELTTSMPAHIASSTGIDALCHLIECFTATVANPVSDNAALIGLRKLVRNIELSVTEPQKPEREAGDAVGLLLWRRGDQPCGYPSGSCPLLSVGRQIPSAARRGERDFAGALYESSAPACGGEICPGLGSDP